MERTDDLKEFCTRVGADLVGIADLVPLKRCLPTVPEDLLDPYIRGISIAVRIGDGIIDSITDRPTPEYAAECRRLNSVLDDISAAIARWIAGKGFKALAIRASFKVDEDRQRGQVSHKAVARMAGIGWQGKSLLIVSPVFGPRIRLTTVLTDMLLSVDQPLRNGCGICAACSEACPAAAIRNVPTESHYESREEAIDLMRCLGMLTEFRALPGIGYTFCGICIRACPYGKARAKKGESSRASSL